MIITISLSEAYELLNKASAIILHDEPGNPLMYLSLSELTGQLDNYFLHTSWNDGGHEYQISFKELNNYAPKIDTTNNTLILTDTKRNEVKLVLLTTMKL